MSQDTLLNCCNRILLNCGERPILTTNSTTGIRVKNALRTAFTDVQTLYDWSWMRVEVTAVSWSNAVAKIENMQRLKSVIYRGTNGCNRVLSSEPYLQATRKRVYVGKPETYALINATDVMVNPYPTTVDEKAKVVFLIVPWLSIPSTDDATFSIVPDAFIDLLIERASAMFAAQFTNDLSLTQVFNSNYETLAQRLRDRYRNVPTDGLNIYRGYR